MKEAIKGLESWKWALHKGQYFKSSNINLASVSEQAGKKTVEFTASTHTIYWPTTIAKKAATFEINLSVNVSTKYFPI